MSATRAVNACVEIHDSRLVSIAPSDGDLIALVQAYVHRSEGRPGIDRGTGWTQLLCLRFRGGRATGDVDALPLELLDGHLTLSGLTLSNLLPLPLSHEGPSALTLQSWNEVQVVIEGGALHGELAGPATYIEEFEP